MAEITKMKMVAKPQIELVTERDENEEAIKMVKVDVEPKLNIKKLLFISRDFPEANEIATLQIGGTGMELDMVKLFKIVYLAYRQANMSEYFSFEDFQEMYEFDMSEATQIYMAMINKEYRAEYLKSIQNAADKIKLKSNGGSK